MVKLNDEMALRLGHAGGVVVPDSLFEYDGEYGISYNLKKEVSDFLCGNEKSLAKEKQGARQKFEEILSQCSQTHEGVQNMITAINHILQNTSFKNTKDMVDLVSEEEEKRFIKKSRAKDEDEVPSYYADVKKELVKRGVEFPINKKLLHLELLSLLQFSIKNKERVEEWRIYAMLGLESMQLEKRLSGESLKKAYELMSSGLEFIHASYEVLKDAISTSLDNFTQSVIVEQVGEGVIDRLVAAAKFEKVYEGIAQKKQQKPFLKDKANRLSLKEKATELHTEVQALLEDESIKKYTNKVTSNYISQSFLITLKENTQENHLNHLNLISQSDSPSIVINPYTTSTSLLEAEQLAAKLNKEKEENNSK